MEDDNTDLLQEYIDKDFFTKEEIGDEELYFNLTQIDEDFAWRYRESRAKEGKGGIITLLRFTATPGNIEQKTKAYYEEFIGKDVKDARFVDEDTYRGNLRDVSMVMYHRYMGIDRISREKKEVEAIGEDLKQRYPRATIIFVPLYVSQRPRKTADTWRPINLDDITPIKLHAKRPGSFGRGKVEYGIDTRATDTRASTEKIKEKLESLVKRSWLRGLRDFFMKEAIDKEGKYDEGKEGDETVNGFFRRTRFMPAALQRLPEDTIHKHYRAWESKYGGTVLRWFISWANDQNFSAPRVSIDTSYGLFVRREGSNPGASPNTPFQIMREFGLSGGILTHFRGNGNIMRKEDAKWLRGQLETQRAASIVTEATRVAYEEATDKAEEVIETVVERETQKAAQTIDKLTALIKSDKENLERLLEENLKLRAALKSRDETNRKLNKDIRDFEVKSERYEERLETLLKRKSPETRLPKKEETSSMGSGPPPPPPPPRIEITKQDIRDNEKEAEKIAKEGKKELSIAPEKAENAVRDAASGAFSAIRKIDLSDFMKRGETRRMKGEKEKLRTPKPEKEKTMQEIMRDALAKKFGGARGRHNANARIFEKIKAILHGISIGELVISSTGHLETRTIDKSQVPCLMCQKAPTIGECVCHIGRFCGQACLEKNWDDGHKDHCLGSIDKE